MDPPVSFGPSKLPLAFGMDNSSLLGAQLLLALAHLQG